MEQKKYSDTKKVSTKSKEFDIEKLSSKVMEDEECYDIDEEDEDNEFDYDGETDTRRYLASESTIAFNFVALIKKIKLRIKKEYPEISMGDLRDKIGMSITDFTLNGQKFEYVPLPNKLGGIRWFVLCPKCKKQCMKLFLPKSKDREEKYLCRNCHKLKPLSLLLGSCVNYHNIIKPLKRLEVIKKKLLIKRLGAKESEKLLEEYESIEKTLSTSPAYRLYKFKKEHGNQ